MDRTTIDDEQGTGHRRLAAHLAELVEAFSVVLSRHVTLARLELAGDARAMGGQAGRLVAFALPIAAGYVLACIAVSLFLGRFVATDTAFALVAVVNVGAGAFGVARALREIAGAPADGRHSRRVRRHDGRAGAGRRAMTDVPGRDARQLVLVREELVASRRRLAVAVVREDLAAGVAELRRGAKELRERLEWKGWVAANAWGFVEIGAAAVGFFIGTRRQS